ncbi:MAG: tRNA pseudouridine(38-40) synthase TruA [Nitrospiria bacterium]
MIDRPRRPPSTRPGTSPPRPRSARPAPPARRPTLPPKPEPVRPPTGGHFKLIVEYDGSRYRGWQEQSNAFTVQEVIKNALNELFPAAYQMAGAGRTDAGVHALGQVVSLHTARAIAPDDVFRELNRRLSKDVNILRVEPAAPDFHARHAAVGRYYLYQVALRRTAFAKAYCWWVKERLDLAAMERSLAPFVGLHDYLAFADARKEDGSTRVNVDRVTMTRHGDLLLIRVAASHFLWKMVRRMVGVLVKIGLGEADAGLSVDELGRRYTVQIPQWTAPAAGLFLERVLYPGDPKPGPPAPLFTL